MTVSPSLRWASGLALVLLVAHLAFLPATLEDIDSLNFALGVRDFDPAQHQPHPPGYPVFIALAKVARIVMPSDAQALALLGALFGALAVFPLLRLYTDLEALDGPPRAVPAPVASLAAALAVTSPLYWFNAGRPMSDVPGLAVTLAAQAVLASAFARQRLNPARTPEAVAESGRLIVLGAFLSALAIGMRSQALWLTLPLIALVLVQRAGRGAAGALLGCAMTFTIGVLIWAVPLVIASGGLMAYRAAIGKQAGEDFIGVDMLYRNPSARRLAFGLLETFVYPWASPILGWTIVALAAVGSLALLRRSPRVVLLLGALAAPYLCFHLLLQETATTRYALPLYPVMAYLAVKGIEALGRAFRPASSVLPAGAIVSGPVAVLVVWSLAVTLPAVRVYAREGSPAFAAVKEVRRRLAADPGAAVGMHQGLARSVQTQGFGRTRVLAAPPMREWLELADYWQKGNTAPVWFLADPARTDIELIDPASRTLHQRYVWGFARERFIRGVRPDVVDLVRIDSLPGWYAEDGWHLTPETLNRSERLRRSEAVAYIKGRPEAAMVVIGGESTVPPQLGPNGMPPDARLSLTIDARAVDAWNLPPGGEFFRRLTLEPGTLGGGAPLRRLVASYALPDGRPAGVRLTAFAVASPDAVFAVHRSGWNEIEYSNGIQRNWRWTTRRAVTFVNSGGRDVVLKVAGESPLRYFETPPHVTVRAGSWLLAEARPSDDFELTVNVPAAALAAADGMVTIETDQALVPYERSGSPDKRTLGLRIFRFEVR